MATTNEETSAVPDRKHGKPDYHGELTRGAFNVPNLITLCRLLLAFVVFGLIDVPGYPLTAAVLFVVAVSTDVLDGWIARRYGLITTLGRILDPFVDKIIVCGAFVFLLERQEQFDTGVNAWMVIIVIGREMFVTSLRGFLEKQGRDFSASLSGKLKMFTQSVAVTASLLSLSPDVAGPRFDLLRDVLLWTAVAVTLWSGLVYVARAVKMLQNSTEPRAKS